MTVLNNIMSELLCFIRSQIEPLATMLALKFLAFYSDLTFDWVSRQVMFDPIHICLNSISFIYWFDLIRSSIMNEFN